MQGGLKYKQDLISSSVMIGSFRFIMFSIEFIGVALVNKIM